MRETSTEILAALKAVQAQQQLLLEKLAGSTAAVVLPTLPEEQPSTPPALLTRADLRKFFGITYCREHLSRLVAKSRFPLPIPLGESVYSRKMWRLTDIQTFVAERPVFDAEFKRTAPQIKRKKSAA